MLPASPSDSHPLSHVALSLSSVVLDKAVQVPDQVSSNVGHFSNTFEPQTGHQYLYRGVPLSQLVYMCVL